MRRYAWFFLLLVASCAPRAQQEPTPAPNPAPRTEITTEPPAPELPDIPPPEPEPLPEPEPPPEPEPLPEPEPAQVASGAFVVRDGAGVPLLNTSVPLVAYPGSLLIEQRYAGAGSSSRFEVNADFEEVRDFYLGAFEEAGFVVEETTSEERPARGFRRSSWVLTRGDERLVLSLEQEANAFLLTVEPEVQA